MEGQQQNMATPVQPKKSGGKGGLILGVVNLVLIIGLAIAVFAGMFFAATGLPGGSSGSSDGSAVTSSGKSLADLYDQVDESVVYLFTEDSQLSFDEQTGQLFYDQVGSLGSGVVYDEDGYIVTNAHVVADQLGTKVFSSVQVAFPATGEVLVARVLAADALNDIAIVKVEARNLATSSFGNIDDVRVGDEVFAVGSPGGANDLVSNLKNTMTAGIVSGLDRSFGILGLSEALYYGSQIPETVPSLAHSDLIQIDAAVNHGNSGGPLYNSKGEVIGINTLVERSNSQQSLSFAVPVDTVSRIAEDVRETGKLTTPYIGIATLTVDQITARQYGFGVEEGALVYIILPNSPAFESKLRPFDVITAVNGVDVSSASEYEEELRKVDAGDTVELEVNQSGARNRIKIDTIETPFLKGI